MKTIENKGGYVSVYYNNVYRFEELIELMKEAFERCRADDCSLLLVNLQDMPGTLKTMDRFKLGVQGAGIFKGMIKIAVVFRKAELNWFAETVAVNRGMNARVFGDMQTARKWLGLD
jgi:hypothetical protein